VTFKGVVWETDPVNVNLTTQVQDPRSWTLHPRLQSLEPIA